MTVVRIVVMAVVFFLIASVIGEIRYRASRPLDGQIELAIRSDEPSSIVESTMALGYVAPFASISQDAKNLPSTAIEVSWRDMPYPKYWINPPFVEHYEKFIDSARQGDLEAIILVSRILENCQFAFESQSELDDAIDNLNQTQSIALPEENEPKYLPRAESVDNWTHLLTSSYENCKGITYLQRQERYELIANAVDSNHPGILFEFSRTIADYEKGVALDTKRWELGDATALVSLSRRHSESYESGSHPENDILAYAYLDAFLKIASSRKYELTDGSFRAPAPLTGLESELEVAKMKLFGNEIETATAISSNLISRNANCCFTF